MNRLLSCACILTFGTLATGCMTKAPDSTENAAEPACTEFEAGVREIKEDAAAARSQDAATVKIGQTS